MNKKKLFKRLAVAGAVVAIVGLSATVGTMAKYMNAYQSDVNGALGAWSVTFDANGFDGTIKSTATTVSGDVIVPGASGSITIDVAYTTSVNATVEISDVALTLKDKGTATAEALPSDLSFELEGEKTRSITAGANSLEITYKWSWADTSEEYNAAGTATEGAHNKYAGMTFEGDISITVTQVNPGANT